MQFAFDIGIDALGGGDDVQLFAGAGAGYHRFAALLVLLICLAVCE